MEKEQRINLYINKYKDSDAYMAAFDYCNRNMTLDDGDKLYLYVMLPALNEYIRWVLTSAKNAGIKRLYFLARDGYQMFLLAKYMVAKYNLEIDCRYLYVSRYAIRIPEYHLSGEKCLDYICSGGIDVTFDKIMKRAGLTDEEALTVAKECGWDTDYERVLNYQEVLNLRKVLVESKKFLPMVYAHSKAAYANAVGYLEQEGLMDNVSYAFVDSGWVGTLQKSIAHLVHSVNKDVRVRGFYFGMYEYPSEVDVNDYDAYYFTPYNGVKRKVYFSNCLFEAVFSSPGGMTTGYTKDNKVNGLYSPKFDLPNNPNHSRIERYAEILDKFAESYSGTFTDRISDKKTNIQVIQSVLTDFMGKPDTLEADAFGEILFSDDLLEKHMQNVSADLSTKEIKKQRFFSKVLIMTGVKKDTIHESAWIEGSIVRNGVQIKSNLWHAHLYKYFVYIRKRLQQGRKRR